MWAVRRGTFTGLVTRVVADGVMAQVEMQCGPFSVVSRMSAESATELKLEPRQHRGRRREGHHGVVETPAVSA